MTALIAYDTESTGKPVWDKPSGDVCQPHLVQIGALLVDADTRAVIDSMDVIVKPDGWTIPAEVIAIHGITNERAHDEGIPEADALDMFMALHARSALRIGHNQAFDARMMRIAIKRYLNDDIAEAFKECPSACTGQLARPLLQLPKNKMPTLAEAYQHCVGQPLANAHNAMADARGCLEVYWTTVSARRQSRRR